MKTARHLLKWGAMAAMAASLPVSGADQTSGVRSPESTISSEHASPAATHGTRTLGPVERTSKLIGKDVLSSDNQKVGTLENVIVDLESGGLLYTVIGSGGILGAGETRFAVPPQVFNHVTGEKLSLKVDKAKLQGAPQFTSDLDQDTEMGKTTFVKQVNQYFGQSVSGRFSNLTSSSGAESRNIHKAKDVVGTNIKSTGDVDFGKVDDLALDLSHGRVTYVILAPDPSLNMNNQLIAFPPSALTLSADGKLFTTDLTKAKLMSAPHFAKNNWPTLSNRTWGAQVYQYYGKPAYFESESQLAPTGPTGDKSLPGTKN